MYSIKALKNSHLEADGPVMFFQSKQFERLQVFGYLWLIRGQGLTVVVDSGIGDPAGEDAPRLQGYAGFVCDPGEDTDSLLRREGLAPDEVDYLILTHLHWDHCVNTRLFTSAKIVVSRRGLASVATPRHRGLVPNGLFFRQVIAHIVDEAWDRVILADDEFEVVPGIRTFWVGGHTECSQAVAVETAKGVAIFGGDTVFMYENIESDIPVAYTGNLAECYLAMDRIRREADIVLPNHDPLVLERHPGGEVA